MGSFDLLTRARPFWLSPRQVLVIPVMVAANDYASEVQKLLRAEGLHADVDLGSNTMAKKIRTGQLQNYNFIIGKCVNWSAVGVG